MHRNSTLVLSWASGEEFCKKDGFKVYLKSLAQIPNADKVVLTHDMSEDVCQMVEDHGAKVFMVDPKEISDYIPRDRFLVYWEYLLDHSYKYDYVLATDSKDVIFQRNPFDWIEGWKNRYKSISGKHRFLNHFVILMSEGFQHKNSFWNLKEQFEFQSDVREPFRREMSDKYVINSGVCMGTPEEMKNYFFLLWITHMKSFGECTDQAALNYLYRFLREDETYCVSQPWSDNLCLTCFGVEENLIQKPKICGNELWSVEMDEPYYIIHQWDRLEKFSQKTLSHYLT